MYDLADYLFGADGHQHELRNTWAGSTERIQTQRVGRRVFTVKNQHWEALYDDGRYLCREVDTSPGNGECYELKASDRVTGDPWARKFMAVGQIFQRSPTVTFRYLSSGASVAHKPPYVDVTWLKLGKHHATWRPDGGIAVDDVLEIAVYQNNSGNPGAEIERYWYGRGKGLVGWKGSIGRSYITKIYAPGEVPDLVREPLNWWKPPEPPPVIELTPVIGELGDPHYGTLKTTAGIYVRASRKVNGATNALALVPNGQKVTYYPDTQQHENGIDWMFVAVGEVSGWMGRVYDTWAEQFSVTPPHTPGERLDPPLVLGNPLSVPWKLSSYFGSPRAYTNFPGKRQEHEGYDFVPMIPTTERVEVLAMQTGKIDGIGYDDDGYGHWVRQVVEWHGHTIKIWYCHMAQRTHLNVGDMVTIGATVGVMGSTGFSSGDHVHITLQWIGHGLSGYVVDDVIDFLQMLHGYTQQEPAPPTSETPAGPEADDVDDIIVPPVTPAFWVPLSPDEIAQAQAYHREIAEQQEIAAQALLRAAKAQRQLVALLKPSI